jgi:hypothetical protein
MKWFEHHSDAMMNKKLKPMIIKYGVEGYGLYFFCVELVARELTPKNVSCEISWDFGTIAHELKMKEERVKEIIDDFCKIGLFSVSKGKLICPKIMYLLDNATSQNPEIKKTLSNFQEVKKSERL